VKKDGDDGSDEMAELSATVLYSVIFGSDRFEFYLGELQFIHSSLFERSSRSEKKKLNKHPKVAKFLQNQREVQIALNISTLIQKYVDYMLFIHTRPSPEAGEDNSSGEAERKTRDDIATQMFIEYVSKDIKDMCKTPLGRSLVRCIGEGILETLYKEQAGKILEHTDNVSSGGWGNLSSNHSILEKVRLTYHQATRAVNYKARLAKSGVNSIVALLKMNKIKNQARAREESVSKGNGTDSNSKPKSVDSLTEFNESSTNKFDFDDDDDDEDEDEKKLATLLTTEEKAEIEVYMDSIRDNM